MVSRIEMRIERECSVSEFLYPLKKKKKTL